MSQPPRYSTLRDAAFGAFAAIAMAVAYLTLTAGESSAVTTAAVVTLATACTMHARLAMGRWRAVTLVVAGAALLAVLGAPPRLLGAVLASGLVGAELVARGTRRAAVLQAGLWTGLAAGFVSASGFITMAALPQRVVAGEAVAALGGAFFGSALMLTLGPIAEWLFGHTTRLTMSEWLSYEHPLLRELASAAPGTFQHSINVGILSDAAARAIGGDALLTRVGGLYHDVGKMRAPEYFIENQGDTNPHDALDPRESARILRAHVSDGVDLVTAHRMGDRIADFVSEHHGTGTMRFFLDKAQTLDFPEALEEEDFRYAGPRPRSRETGIAMIADQLEATARANAPADEAACDQLVGQTVQRIVEDEELAESGLTESDINLIQPALTRTLMAMYHRRLSYPPEPAQSPRKAALLSRLLTRRPSRP